MFQSASQRGLIVAAGTVRHADAVREMTDETGWSIVAEATVWLVRRQLAHGLPKLTLFWLEHENDLQATAALVGWLRDEHPAIWRAVIAYRLAGDVELTLRASGVQLYLPTWGSIRDLVRQSILPLVSGQSTAERRTSEQPAKTWSGRDGPRAAPPPHGRLRQPRHPP